MQLLHIVVLPNDCHHSVGLFAGIDILLVIKAKVPGHGLLLEMYYK